MKKTSLSLLCASLAVVGSVASSQAAVIVQNPSFESYTVNAPISPFGFAYTAPFGSNLTDVANWTLSPSQGSPTTGTYAGIVTGGDLQSPTPYPNGSTAVFVEVLGSVSQNLTGFDIGTQYTVSFYAAPRNLDGFGGQDLSVKFDSTALTFSGSSTLDVPASGGWVLYTTDAFTANATSYALSFTGVNQGDFTTYIDNVSVTVVPEPATVVLVGLAASVCTLFRKRRTLA